MNTHPNQTTLAGGKEAGGEAALWSGMAEFRSEEVIRRAGPLAWTATHVAIERGGRVDWAAARERVTGVRVCEKSKWGHPALAILLAAAIILPFSWAMLMLSRHNSWRVFIEQLLLALAVTVVAAGVTFMSVFRRIRTGKVVEVRAGERKIAVPVSDAEAGMIDAVLREMSAEKRQPSSSAL